MTKSIKICYCDMDGVIADFAKRAKELIPSFHEAVPDTADSKKLYRKQDALLWSTITNHQRDGGLFWEELDPMEDANVLWDYINTHYEVHILSATGQSRFGADAQKRVWLKKHFGLTDESKIHLVSRAVEKAQFADPACILIDDKTKALDPWIEAGGIGVLHVSAANTIDQLEAI